MYTICMVVAKEKDQGKAFKLQKLIDHIAFIMDGNGRWAKARGLPRHLGHKAACERIIDVLNACMEFGIRVISLYAFSTENWNRPEDEVKGLMNLLVTSIEKELAELHENGVRLIILGDLSRLSNKVRKKVEFAVTKTASNTELSLQVALSYSGRWEIATAAQRIAADCIEGKITPADITETSFQQYLSTAGIPDPELMIRTSGEMRISNFLLYQLAYSELYFPSLHWPEFTKETLFEAIINYQNRERRFGKTSEQIKT